MPFILPKNANADQIMALLRQHGMTADTQNNVKTPSGGSITQPVMYPPSGNIASAMGFNSQQPPVNQTGSPAIYQSQAAPSPLPSSGQFNMSSYLDSKLGPTPGYVQSVTPLYTAGRTDGGGGSAGQAGGSDPALGGILQSFTDQFNKANAANEKRFKQANQTLDTMGAGYRNDLNTQFKQDVSHQEQDAVNRGLGNTTVRNGLISQAKRRMNDATLNLNDKLAAQKVNLLSSKYDNAPDPMQISQLLSQATNSAYGSGNTLASIAAALGLNK